MAPERRVLALDGGIVQHEEIADALVFAGEDAVVALGVGGRAGPVGQQRQEHGQTAMHQMQPGRFQRFEKAGGQPQRQAVAAPHPAAASGDEAQRARRADRRAVQPRHQLRLRRVVVDEAAAIDIAVADAVLQRDAPLPARLAPDGQGVRRRRRVAGALHGDGAVAGQPARPVLIAGLQRLLDQQAAKAAAIYEEVAVDARAVLQIEALDEAGFGMQRDVRHPAFDAAHAARLGEAA